MKLKSTITFNILMLIVSALSAQDIKRNNTWMLGGYGTMNMGLDFNSGSPDTFSLIRPMEFFITNASICDTNGQLLFYTNGDYIANRNHNRLYNSTNFNPTLTGDSVYGLNISQAALIIPYCGLNGRYILFHENGEHIPGDFLPMGLYYSEIDMTLDSGMGGIVSNRKTIPVIVDSLIQGKITACRHGNGRDWWIVAHRWNSDLFYVVYLSPDSIQISTQNIGSEVTFDAGGQTCFSPDGNRFAFLMQDRHLNIFEFDRCSGTFSILDTFIIPDPGLNDAGLGCAFSPNGQYLYVCNNFEIYQYDLLSSNIQSSVITVAHWDSSYMPLATYFFSMLLAPDNKIYVTTYEGTNVLHVIENPDSAGLSCNVIQHGLILPSYNAHVLPNVPNYGLGSLSGSSCDTITSTANIDFIETSVFLYPNPANYTLHISWGPLAFIRNKPEVRITNVLGQTFDLAPQCNTNQYTIDISSLKSGVYIIELSSGQYRVIRKIIIE